MTFSNSVVAGLTLVRPAIRSPNYQQGVAGWSVNQDGSAEFNNATLRAQMIVGTTPRYRFIGNTAPAELLTWAASKTVVLFMVDIWYMDSTVPSYIWEAIATDSGNEVRIKGTYNPAIGVVITERIFFSAGDTVVRVGSSTLDSIPFDLIYWFEDTTVVIGSDSNITLGGELHKVSGSTFTNDSNQEIYTFRSRLYVTSGSSDITVSGNAGVRLARVWAVGGGGGGGGCASTAAGQSAVGAGGGGGGGAYVEIPVASWGTKLTCTAGAGGSGGAAGANNGANGSASTVVSSGGTTLASAAGGDLGQGGAASASTGITQAGNGGIGTVGDMLTAGHDGMNAVRGLGAVGCQGAGGGSAWGFGGGQRANGTDAGGAGIAGNQYGGGGSGGHNQASQGTGKAGGDGATGVVILDLYF